MDLLRPFRLPYPSYLLDLERGNRNSMIVGGAVFLVLILLQPFGIELSSWSVRIKDASIFGFISVIFFRLNLFLNSYLMKIDVLKDEKWTIGKETCYQVWFLFLLGIINWITGHYLFGCIFNTYFFLRWQWETFSVGIFPVATLIFLRQYNLLKKYSSSANDIEAKLSALSIKPIHENRNSLKMISFSDDPITSALPINPNDISYIVAADNYIRINYFDDTQIKGLLVRSTLKTAEKKLEGFDNFYRCHRSYLVNLNLIRHISGNSTGYKLHLEGINDLIPVSRNLNNEISEKINSIILS